MKVPTNQEMGDSQRLRTAADPSVRLTGAALLLARIAWLLTAVLSVGLFVVGIPSRLEQLLTVSAHADRAVGQLRPEDAAALAQAGLSVGFYASYLTALVALAGLVFVVFALLLFWRKSDDRTALLASLTCLALISALPSTTAFMTRAPLWELPVTVLQAVAVGGMVIFLYIFPDGQFVPGWTRWLTVGWVVYLLSWFVFPAVRPPLHSGDFRRSNLPALLWLLSWLGSGILAQVVRYRRVSTASQRQQTKWVIFSFALGFVLRISGLIMVVPALLQPESPAPLMRTLSGATLLVLAIVAVPLALTVSILRYRLWDIDLLINRTLVYGALTASVAGGYALIVGALGALFQAEGSFLVALLATGLIAVLVQPLRVRVQRAVNHLLYGERDEPYTVLSRLGQRLEATLAPNAVLPAIVQTIAEALKLPYVAIALATVDRQPTTDDRPPTGDVAIVDLPISQIPNADDGFGVVAAYGTPTGELLRLPLVYQHEIVGQLRLAPRARGEVFTPADRRLLEDLARQAGVAASAVRLTLDLQRARAQLILAREEERRRLRRDLHDGLGPALAAQTLKVGSARALLTRDPATADALLAGLETDIATAIADIRRLVYNLRPPALEELGLLGAIRQHVAQYRGNGASGLQIVVEAPEALLPLPAAVEVAAYRIVQEALTNVVRHAQARTCRIRLTLNGALSLEIRDDGVGLPAIRQAGVGLVAMRERAAELGGMCVVEPASGGGTCVRARLPFAECDT